MANQLLGRHWMSALALCAAIACEQSKVRRSDLVSASAPAPAPPPKPAEKMLDPGEAAPSFSVLAHTGMAADSARFSDKPLVVLFCPAVAAASCESTVSSLRDAWHGLRTKLSMIFVITTEDRIRLREYAYANELPFLLLADHDAAVARAFGAGTPGSGAVQLFLISPQKKIAARLPEPSPEALRQWLTTL